MTQHEQIIAYLEEYGSITPMEAFSELGITKLSTRIGELVRSGEDIKREMVNAQNRFGDPVHFMRYCR